MAILLDTVKAHCRVTGSDDDTLLAAYQGAAWDYVRAFTNQDWPDNQDAPAAVNAAVLLVIADLYENREAQTPGVLTANKTVDRLLWPHRVFPLPDTDVCEVGA